MIETKTIAMVDKHLNVSPDLWRRVKTIAVEKNMTISELVSQLLKQSLSSNPRHSIPSKGR